LPQGAGIALCCLTGAISPVAWVYPVLWPALGAYLIATAGKQAKQAQA
jgi:hypothetical protein